MDDLLKYLFYGFIGIIALILYFLPTIISFNKGHKFLGYIFAINFFAFLPVIGWGGWILSLLVSFSDDEDIDNKTIIDSFLKVLGKSNNKRDKT